MDSQEASRSAGDELEAVPPLLCCLVASHIRSVERAQQLARMLLSIASQVPRPPQVAISWSCEEGMAARVRDTIAAARESGLQIRSCEQPTKHSQFEHLRHLCTVRGGSMPWRARR